MFTLTLRTSHLEDYVDSDAYTNEVVRVLRQTADQIERDGVNDGPEHIHDIDGNHVGDIRYF